eukprot:14481138-Ditylum_brightwellii.AAC.1
MKDRGLNVANVIPKVHCKSFKGNTGALELVKTPRCTCVPSTSMPCTITSVIGYIISTHPFISYLVTCKWLTCPPSH